LHLLAIVSARHGRAEAAVRHLRRATTVNPGHPGAWCALGSLLHDLGNYPEAVAAFDRALALRADIREAWFFRGAALSRAGRSGEALVDVDRALALGLNDANLQVTRAAILINLGRAREAAESCHRALALQPDLAVAHVNLAGALYLMEDMGAEAAGRKAVSLAPADANAHAHLGASLLRGGSLDEALSHLTRATELNPSHPTAHNTRALCLMDLGRADEARESCRRAITLQPNRSDAYTTRGLLQPDPESALRDFDKAISLNPDAIEPRFNKGLCLLQQGDFHAGWELYEFRPKPKMKGAGRDRLWNGSEDVAGKCVLTYAEQGLGDTIQFSRFAKLRAARGAQVVLSLQDSLCGLFDGFDGGIRVIGRASPLPAFDRHIPLLSLPRVFGTTLEAVGTEVPYLSATDERIAKWRDRLGAAKGRRIGIRWQGSTTRADVGRSFRLHELAPLAAVPQVQLMSLQKDAGIEQLLLPRDWPVTVPGEEFDFLDTAALMTLCDLVITSDTSVAHLAGALGCPTWVALKHRPDWRWMLQRNDSPWYPTVRLFRQDVPGDWPGVFTRMQAALAGASAPGGSSSDDPVSPRSGSMNFS
jgi:tetratricopeptide (TPR) repeat protein